MKMRITRLGATHDRKPLGAVGDVIEVDDEARAKALRTFRYAEPVKDEPEAAKPEDGRETATDPNAGDRETREGGESKPEPSAKDIREWANANDVDVPSRGAIPADVRAAYLKAHDDAATD